ncbi:MaoC family dehydratase [Peribacillus simplex]|uniref:MaoC family dehydratase n=1 Tax=Peribacillus simplex TaxID=1478 RepID=A0A9X8ZFA9_9BACI|nr:MaoC family dehydratase [Peribacillus simplex]TKH09531.1 MaoC family dehydratase [Peribacillus simplex]
MNEKEANGLVKLERLLGHELEPYSMAVEIGKIKELAIAIGDDNPIF